MELAFIIVICIIIVLFTPNNGEVSLFDKLTDWNYQRNQRSIALNNQGSENFIRSMINDYIQTNNDYYRSMGETEDMEDFVTEVDPYRTYIFQGGCYGCTIPQEESVTGCLTCSNYSNTATQLRFKG